MEIYKISCAVLLDCAMDNREYTHRNIRGVNVIVWDHIGNVAKVDKSIKNKRKQLKNKVGRENLDTPMLDVRQYNDQLQYCDIIICTDHLLSWDRALNTYYAGRVDIKPIKAGHQLVILCTDKSTVYVTINVYTNTNKLMIQPGSYEEENLLAFLSEFDSISSLCMSRLKSVVVTVDARADTTDDTATKTLVSPVASRPPNRPDVFTTPSAATGMSGTTTELNLSTPITSGITQIQSASPAITTRMDTQSHDDSNTKFTDTACQTMDAQPAVDDATTQTPAAAYNIVNELLCFIQNRLDTMPLDVIVKLTADFYPAGDIAVGKEVIYDIVKPTERLRKRRGDSAGKEDARDICKMMLQTDVDKLPTFVAKNLSNLPPMTIESFDVCGLMKNMEEMKNTVRCLVENQSTLSSTVRNLAVKMNYEKEESGSSSRKSGSIETRSHPYTSVKEVVDNPTVNTNTAVKELADTPNVRTTAVKEVLVIPTDDTNTVVKEVVDSPTVSTSNDCLEADDDNDSTHYVTLDFTTGTQDSSLTLYNVSVRNNFSVLNGPRHSSPIPAPVQPAIRREEAIRVVHGMGKYATVQTQPRSQRKMKPRDDTNSHSNRTVIGLFISRLPQRMTARQMELRIRREARVNVRVEKLQTRYPTYSSFFIRCDSHVRRSLSDPSIWPQGALVKPFYSE